MHAMWSRLFWPAVSLVMVSVAALLFRHALFVAVRRWSGHRTTEESLFLRAIRVPSMLWCIVLGLFVAIEMAELPPRLAAPIHAVLEAAIILSVTLTVAGVLGSLVAAAGERRALAVGVTGLFRTSVRLTVLSVGGLVLLSSLGIAITPILTALGDLAWLVILPVALLLREPDQNRVTRDDAAHDAEQREYTTRQVLAAPQFWAIALTHFACCAAHSGPIFHMVTHATDQGVAAMAAATEY